MEAPALSSGTILLLQPLPTLEPQHFQLQNACIELAAVAVVVGAVPTRAVVG